MRTVIRNMRQLVLSILFWTAALICFYFMRYLGLQYERAITVDKSLVGRTFEWLLVLGSGGFVLGIFNHLSNKFFERPYFKRQSFGGVLLMQFGVYSVFMMIVANFVNILIKEVFSFNVLFGNLFTHHVFWIFVGYFTVLNFLYNFFNMVRLKFGTGVLKNILIGKFRKPQEEDRIFMFLDLKSSTAIAEQLGHIKYSKLIQECFYDLNEIVLKYQGEIYQYVGDEAVISWPAKRGVKNANCLKCFFSFQDLLDFKSDVYLNKYGVIPEFKAGLHGGILVVTEVGVVKKEIAYHGDVINTTARIQGECNTFGKDLLVSNNLLMRLDYSDYQTELLGEVFLKGKSNPVQVHGVSKFQLETAKPTIESAVP